MKRLVLSGLSLVCLLLTAGNAHAAVITFDGTTSTTGIFSGTFTEAGYTLDISALYGDVLSGNVELEPVSPVSGGSLTVTRSGGLFSFTSVDLQVELSGRPATFQIEGFLGATSQGVDVLTATSTSYATFDAVTLVDVLVDRVVITGSRGKTDGIAFDNLALDEATTSVPEPTSIALVASGLAGVLLRRRRRTA